MMESDGTSAELPKGWVWTTVDEISNLIRGVSYKRDQASNSFRPGSLPIIRAGNIQERLILEDNLIFVDSHLITEEQIIRSGDVILAMSSGSADKVGKTAQARFDWSGSFGVFCGILRPREEIDPWFFGAFFETQGYRNKISNLAKGVNINNLRRQHLESFLFPLPPLSEQKRIVARIEELFSHLDTAVDALQKAKVQLKRYRQAVLKAAVEGKLTGEWRKAHPDTEPSSIALKRILDERRAKWEEKEITKLIDKGQLPKNDRWKQKYKEPVDSEIGQHPLLPEGWVWATIEQLASSEARSIQSGPFGSTLHHSEFQNEGVLAIGIDNVLDGRFSMGKEHRISLVKFEQLKKYSARPLDVLITVMATVGRCCVVPEGFEEAIITKHVYRISVNQSFINPYYLMHCLLGGSEIRDQIFKKLRGQTRPGINGAILKQIAVPVPLLKEQLEIVAEMERILSIDDSIKSMVRIELKLANRLRQSILKRAFEGKLIPQNPCDEPASALLERIKAEKAEQLIGKGRKNNYSSQQMRLVDVQ